MLVTYMIIAGFGVVLSFFNNMNGDGKVYWEEFWCAAAVWMLWPIVAIALLTKGAIQAYHQFRA